MDNSLAMRRNPSPVDSRHPIVGMLFGISTTLLLLVVALHSVVMEEETTASYAAAIEDAVDGILQSLSRKRSANDDPCTSRAYFQHKMCAKARKVSGTNGGAMASPSAKRPRIIEGKHSNRCQSTTPLTWIEEASAIDR